MKIKIIRKNIKHMYAEVKKDYIEIRCNPYVSDEVIFSFVKKIKLKLKPKESFVFGKVAKIKEEDYKKLEQIVLNFVEEYSQKMNLFPSKISFRFKKTSWGSCTAKNHIIFNYKLVNLPINVIEYVVVHELAHIKEKNHSDRFWNLVKKYMSDYKKRIKLLKEYEKRI